MDLLSLVQWLGCLAALGGGTVVAWLAEPASDRTGPDGRRRTATGGGVLLLLVFVGWWFSVDLEMPADDLVQEAASLAGAVGGLSLVFLVLLLTAGEGLAPGAWPHYRRAAGLLMAGFGAAAAASLQIGLVGTAWGAPGWLALAGFLVACCVVVLAQSQRQATPH